MHDLKTINACKTVPSDLFTKLLKTLSSSSQTLADTAPVLIVLCSYTRSIATNEPLSLCAQL
jgi:hypothetical protein